MTRIIRKARDNSYCHLYDLQETYAIIDKLGRHEDFEEHLHIEILTLEAIRMSNHVYVRKGNGDIVVGYVDNINLMKRIFRGRYQGEPDLKKGFSLKFDDYGKMISLDKEDLLNYTPNQEDLERMKQRTRKEEYQNENR